MTKREEIKNLWLELQSLEETTKVIEYEMKAVEILAFILEAMNETDYRRHKEEMSEDELFYLLIEVALVTYDQYIKDNKSYCNQHLALDPKLLKKIAEYYKDEILLCLDCKDSYKKLGYDLRTLMQYKINMESYQRTSLLYMALYELACLLAIVKEKEKCGN